MTLNRYAAKRDKNESAIVDALKGIGCSVLKLSGAGVPDLACYFQSQWFLLDTKSKKGRLTKNQDWAETISPDAVKIVHSADEALYAIGAIR